MCVVARNLWNIFSFCPLEIWIKFLDEKLKIYSLDVLVFYYTIDLYQKWKTLKIIDLCTVIVSIVLNEYSRWCRVLFTVASISLQRHCVRRMVHNIRAASKSKSVLWYHHLEVQLFFLNHSVFYWICVQRMHDNQGGGKRDSCTPKYFARTLRVSLFTPWW